MPRHPESQVFFTYKMPFGSVTIAADGRSVTRVVLGERDMGPKREPSALTNECASQLVEYLSGKRTVFDLPISHDGSEFQAEVWEAIRRIPYAQTRTNREIAEAIGKPGSYRMVGSAVKQNPLAILIPAHRVVPASGHVDKSDPHALLRAAFRDLERKFA